MSEISFLEFRERIASHFMKMSENASRLYVTEADGYKLCEIYLESFRPEDNPIYRVRREFDCSCCFHFIRNIGNVVSISDGAVTSLWDVDLDGTVYEPVVRALSEYVKSKPIADVFLSSTANVGTKKSQELCEDCVITYNHLFVQLPQRFVFHGRGTLSGERAAQKDLCSVFKRSLEEISLDSIDTVLELIRSNTLYRGKEWQGVLEAFRSCKVSYDKLSDSQKVLFAWEKSAEAGVGAGKIRNHSIGVLLTDITEGVDLNRAVTRYEKIVAPANYKRPKALFTEKMLEEAQKTIIELGYLDSLGRRYASLDDISVNNILFANRDASGRISGAADIFADLAKSAKKKPRKFDRVEEVSPEVFVNDILPTATEVELFLENRHQSNLVSLIAPKVSGSKTMFKWNNNFSWAYAGNVTDSMKERVKSFGGRVDGDLRFSIQWNDGANRNDDSDLDAHCITPDSKEIFYASKRHERTGGELDVDIQHPSGNIAVENITWPARKRMLPGSYRFFVNQFADRNHQNGFRAEIEFDGTIYAFDYPEHMKTGENVDVAVVTLSKDGTFSITEKLPSSQSSKEIWGIRTLDFIPVTVICYSPNYWDEQNGIGNQHLFFMLKGCVNPESPNGFYNEFLKSELAEHKRVFEALGSRMRVEETPDQLSGVGFSLTKRDEVVVRVKGSTERIIKIKF